MLPVAVLVAVLWAGGAKAGRSVGEDHAAGAQAFERSCARCHSLDGSTSAGPSLKDVGRRAALQRPNYTAEQYLLESILEPDAFRPEGVAGAMPRVIDELDDSTIRSLVVFLANQGGEANVRAITSLPIIRKPKPAIPTPHRASIERGEEIFHGKGNCMHCHFRGSPDAPSMEGVGRLGAEHIRESILDPDRSIPAAYRQWVVTKADWRTYTGQLLRRAEQEVVLSVRQETRTRTVLRFPVAELDVDEQGRPRIVESTKSPMPSARGVLTADEVQALVDYLATFRER
jgi:mono/diheme cytochrome c family protein